MKISYKLAELFVTVFYLGKIKFAPGTFGSLVAFPLYYAIINLVGKYQYSSQILVESNHMQKNLSLFLKTIF